jgi:hypothetical protein
MLGRGGRLSAFSVTYVPRKYDVHPATFILPYALSITYYALSILPYALSVTYYTLSILQFAGIYFMWETLGNNKRISNK